MSTHACVVPLLHARRLLVVAALLAIAGCGGGAETVENPATSNPGTPATYTGPAPATSDVQAFKVNLWDNLQAANRCGQCHADGGL